MSLREIEGYIGQLFHYKLFEINRTPVTPSSIAMFIIVIAIFYGLSRLLSECFFAIRFFTHFHIDEGAQFTLSRISHYLVMIIGSILAFQFVGIDLRGLAVIVGLLSVGIGFGLPKRSRPIL